MVIEILSYLILMYQLGSVQLQEGYSVRAGQQMAAVGNTGNTTEPHLHLHAVTDPQK